MKATPNVGDLVRVSFVKPDDCSTGWIDKMYAFERRICRVVKQYNGRPEWVELVINHPVYGEDHLQFWFPIGWLVRTQKAEYVRPRDKAKKAKEGPVIAKEKVEEECKTPTLDAVSNLHILMDKHMRAHGVGLCGWAWRTEAGDVMKHSAPCHAVIAYFERPVKELCLSVGAQYRNMSGYHREQYARYVDYIVNRSPWKSAFIPAPLDEILETGVYMDVNQPGFIIYAACIALREGNEYRKFTPMFCEILDKGYHPHTAYILSRGFMGTFDNPMYSGVANGHRVLSGLSGWPDMFEFFRNGYSEESKEGEAAYKVAGKCHTIVAFTISRENRDHSLDNLIKSFSVGGMKKVKDMFGRITEIPCERKSLAEVCARLDSEFVKEAK